MKSKFTKIFIEGYDYTFLYLGLLENCPVFAPGCICTNPDDVMPSLSQGLYCFSWEVLIRKNSH